jgi:hypothetical protein
VSARAGCGRVAFGRERFSDEGDCSVFRGRHGVSLFWLRDGFGVRLVVFILLHVKHQHWRPSGQPWIAIIFSSVARVLRSCERQYNMCELATTHLRQLDRKGSFGHAMNLTTGLHDLL